MFFNDTTDWVVIKVRSKFLLFFDRTFYSPVSQLASKITMVKIANQIR